MKKYLLFVLLLVFCLVGCGKSDADSNSDSYDGIYRLVSVEDDIPYDEVYENEEPTYYQFSEGVYISYYKTENDKPDIEKIEFANTLEESYKQHPVKPTLDNVMRDPSQKEGLKSAIREKYNINVLKFAMCRDMGDGYLYPLNQDVLWKYVDGKIIFISSKDSHSDYYKFYLKRIENI